MVLTKPRAIKMSRNSISMSILGLSFVLFVLVATLPIDTDVLNGRIEKGEFKK